ncbi:MULTISPECIES: 4'-phosphopantetheinyl transferase [unclassified Paracoccus (in: a-proteobacteria)]|uniref:4'-phosphopantetheinyl transferase family protein n=1 Tax=unclassified Paracoccus (in: a-proteobacteria) TaxID=2688777 RepID=UPI00048E44A9|nr:MULTISPECIES: 4'-phosphopantetheinyl transferase [unclassified Paracoccus (in: a-proteobacteria)]
MSGAEALEALARRLLPAGHGCAVLPLTAEPAPLLPEEAGAIARAVPKRRREFALGRMALRAAIRQAGHDLPADRPIPARSDRRPDLPPGIRASLSHGGDYCIAIAAPPGGASVGVDLEPCDRALPEGLAETIMPFRLNGAGDALLAFCAKEAMFKAQYPLTGRMLDFRAVPAVIDAQRFRACMGDRLIGGRWGQAAGYWLALSLWRG